MAQPTPSTQYIFKYSSILVEPSNADLAAKLGLKTSASRHHYDLITIGGGPAGLTAGLYTAREGIDTLVIERAALGGQAAATERLGLCANWARPGAWRANDGITWYLRLCP